MLSGQQSRSSEADSITAPHKILHSVQAEMLLWSGGLMMSKVVVCRCMMGCRQVWKVYMQLVICLMWSGGKLSQLLALAAWQLCQPSATSPPIPWRGNITPRSRSALLQFHIPHLVAIRWEALSCAVPCCVRFATQSVPCYALLF